MMLRVLMVALISTCWGEDPHARILTRSPQGHIKYSDPTGLKVNWKLYAPHSQWKSHLEQSRQKTQQAEPAAVQQEAQFQIQPAAQVEQPKPQQVHYKSYDQVPSHIKRLLLQVYGSQEPYFDPQAFAHQVPLQVLPQAYNQEPALQSQKSSMKNQMTQYKSKFPMPTQYDKKTSDAPEEDNEELLSHQSFASNRYNTNVPYRVQPPVYQVEQPDLQSVQYKSYNQVPSHVKQMLQSRASQRPYVQPEVIVHRIPTRVLPQVYNQEPAARAQKSSMDHQITEYRPKSLMLDRYSDKTSDEPQAENQEQTSKQTMSHNRYSKNAPLESEAPGHHLEQPDVQPVQYTAYNQVPSYIKQILQSQQAQKPHRTLPQVLPQVHDQEPAPQSQKSSVKNQKMESGPKYLTQPRYYDEVLKDPQVENLERLPETLPIQPISYNRYDVPLRIQQLLQFQAQIPYNVIANRIVYRPKTIFIPKPLPQGEKGPYEYRSQVYRMDDFEEINEQSVKKPVNEKKE